MAKIQRETARGFAVGEYASTTVTNTATETTLFSQTIQAGAMGLNKELTFKIVCTLSTGVLPPSLTIRIKLGTTTISVLNAQSLATSLSSASPFIIDGMICNNNTVSAQFMFAKIQQPSTTLPLLLSASSSMASADWTVDTSVDQTFAITAQFGSASTAASLVFKHATIELT
jgi:hypothetical protein